MHGSNRLLRPNSLSLILPPLHNNALLETRSATGERNELKGSIPYLRSLWYKAAGEFPEVRDEQTRKRSQLTFVSNLLDGDRERGVLLVHFGVSGITVERCHGRGGERVGDL